MLAGVGMHLTHESINTCHRHRIVIFCSGLCHGLTRQHRWTIHMPRGDMPYQTVSVTVWSKFGHMLHNYSTVKVLHIAAGPQDLYLNIYGNHVPCIRFRLRLGYLKTNTLLYIVIWFVQNANIYHIKSNKFPCIFPGGPRVWPRNLPWYFGKYMPMYHRSKGWKMSLRVM